jgi:hypothetical protein
MDEPSALPNGRILLDALMLTPEMLRALPRAPVPGPALRALLRVLIARLPFDAAFYAATYPDLAQAKESGAIEDLREHFLEHGYLEGRLGAAPEIDEDFYREMYPDVAAGIARGDIRSASEHYIGAGAGEGRFANAAQMQACRQWQEILSGR